VRVVLAVNVMLRVGFCKNSGCGGGGWGGREVHIPVMKTLSVINHRVMASSARYRQRRQPKN
jgi:hypothetical protein